MRFVTFLALVLRRAPVTKLLRLSRRLDEHDIPIAIDALYAHHLAGGDVVQVVEALIFAKSNGIPVIFDRLCAIDLAAKYAGIGANLLDWVKGAAATRVYRSPQRGFHEFVAPDCPTWRLGFVLRYTVCLDRVIGGVDLETLASNIVKLVSTLHRERPHLPPSRISQEVEQAVLSAGLDRQSRYNLTACEVESE